jgi:hypothetical protein
MAGKNKDRYVHPKGRKSSEFVFLGLSICLIGLGLL